MSSRSALLWLGSVFALFFVSIYLDDHGQSNRGAVLLVIDFVSLVGLTLVGHGSSYRSRRALGERLSAGRRRASVLLLVVTVSYLVLSGTSAFHDHLDRLIVLSVVLVGLALAVAARAGRRP